MIEIRIASPEEAESIAKLLQTAFAEFESFYMPEAFAATVPEAEKIRERFSEGMIWAASRKETLVGTVSTVAENEKLYIRSMAVLPTAQNLGIGRKLLEAIEKFALENEFKSLFLYTTPFLLGAISLYRQNGFEQVSEVRSDDFFGTSWFAMEKKLN